MTEQSLAEILPDLKWGNAEAWKELHVSYNDRLFRYAMRLVRNAVDAQEVVQNAWMSLLTKIPACSELKEAYLFRAVVLAAMTLWSQRKHSKETVSLSGSQSKSSGDATLDPEVIHTPDPAHAAALKESIGWALERLSRKLRDVVVLHDTEGLDFQTIADCLGVSVPNVRTRHKTAMAQLRSFLRDWEP